MEVVRGLRDSWGDELVLYKIKQGGGIYKLPFLCCVVSPLSLPEYYPFENGLGYSNPKENTAVVRVTYLYIHLDLLPFLFPKKLMNGSR